MKFRENYSSGSYSKIYQKTKALSTTPIQMNGAMQRLIENPKKIQKGTSHQQHPNIQSKVHLPSQSNLLKLSNVSMIKTFEPDIAKKLKISPSSYTLIHLTQPSSSVSKLFSDNYVHRSVTPMKIFGNSNNQRMPYSLTENVNQTVSKMMTTPIKFSSRHLESQKENLNFFEKFNQTGACKKVTIDIIEKSKSPTPLKGAKGRPLKANTKSINAGSKVVFSQLKVNENQIRQSTPIKKIGLQQSVSKVDAQRNLFIKNIEAQFFNIPQKDNNQQDLQINFYPFFNNPADQSYILRPEDVVKENILIQENQQLQEQEKENFNNNYNNSQFNLENHNNNNQILNQGLKSDKEISDFPEIKIQGANIADHWNVLKNYGVTGAVEKIDIQPYEVFDQGLDDNMNEIIQKSVNNDGIAEKMKQKTVFNDVQQNQIATPTPSKLGITTNNDIFSNNSKYISQLDQSKSKNDERRKRKLKSMTQFKDIKIQVKIGKNFEDQIFIFLKEGNISGAFRQNYAIKKGASGEENLVMLKQSIRIQELAQHK